MIEWSVASRPMVGQTVSGDGSLVEVLGDEVLLVGIDGLGHGKAAAAATTAALAGIREGTDAPLEAIVRRCHQRLHGTRGAAMSLARVSAAGRVRWLGIGNVECLLLRAQGGAREAAPLRGGVVGARLPTLRVTEVNAAPGDLLVLATDGVASAFADRMPRVGAVEQLAADIVARHGRSHDDVLVLVARYLGGPG